jgi:hypothetical protein
LNLAIYVFKYSFTGFKCNGSVEFVAVEQTSLSGTGRDTLAGATLSPDMAYNHRDATPGSAKVIRRKGSRYGVSITSDSTAKMRFVAFMRHATFPRWCLFEERVFENIE